MTTRWEIRVDEANPEEEIPLTENGRIVLERRYLRKGPDGRPVETIPQMFRRVARAIAEAEKELGGDPALWEERFYQLLTSLRFLPNSPTFTGAGTPLGQLAACFTPEMRVITEHGLKRIADLQPGDRVLTHRGRYQPVLQTSRRFYRGPLRIIKVRRIGQRIEATPEHPFLTPRGWVMAADLRPGDRVAIGFPKGILPTPSFDLAETLSGEDLEVQSTPTTIRVRRPAAYQNSGRQARWIPRHIPLSSEIARLCGYYVAEGTLGPDLEYVRFTFSIKEKEYHANISNILSSILGFTPIMNSSRGNWVHIDLYNRALAQWFFAQFGRHSYNKRIPIWMQYTNFDLQEEFLTGLFRGDGFYSEKAYLINGRKSTKLFRAFRLTLSNPTLVFQTRQILIRLGYEASIRGVDTTYVTPNAREAAQIIMPPLRSRRLIEKSFGIHLPDAGVSNNGVLRDEEHVYFEIENINEIYYEEYVYNCEVEEDHTYVVEGVVVHNCFVLPLEDDMGKIPGGIFQTLRDAALIQQTGGGNGFSFSRLRPKNAIVFSSMGRATGPVGFLRVYDRAFGEIAQGGCLTPDTLVFTEKGLLRLDEIVDPEQPGWHPHHLTVLTDEGPRLSPHGYNRGRSPVLRVVTREGLTLTGTPDHKVKVRTREGWVWRRLDELQPGDAIPVILGQHRGQLQTLQPVETRHGNQVAPRLPQVLDEELAFFLGYLTGDGFVAQSEDDHRVGVSVANDSYLIEEMPRLMERLFGVRVHVRRKPGDGSTIFVIDNRAVKEFLQINGLGKGRSTQACVPRLIRLSPPSVVAAYLRGLFEADGTIRHGYPELCTASERLAHEVAVLLIGLGCPAVVRRGRPAASRKGNSTPWRVHVVSPAGLRAWAERIGCDPRSRFRACQEHTPDEKRGLHYPLPEPSYWLSPVLEAITLPPRDRRGRGKGLKLWSTQPPLRRTLLRYLRGDSQLTLSNYIRLSEQYPEFARHAPPVGDRWFVFVQSVEPAGEALTLDLEVEQNHTYLANGMVTHNSRRGANMAVLRVDHPDIEEFITCKTDENAITNFNISVGITDAFMRAVENDEEWELRFPDVLHPAYRNFRGTLEDAERAGIPIRVYKRVRARDLFRKIATQAHHNGEPGVLFLDTANRSNPVPHLYTLEATNPCVTGDTLVATPQGWRYAAEIRVGDEICTVLGTGRVERIEVYEQRPVYRVFLSDGGVIKVTAAHQFHVRDSRTKYYEPRRVDQLKPGDWVRVFPARMPNNPVPDKPPHLSDREFGFLIGVLIGDGCYTERALSRNVVRISTHADEEEWNAMLEETFRKLGATHFVTYVNPGSRSMMIDPKPGRVIAGWVRTLLLPPARSPEKRLPLAYINSNREFLEGLLDGLFSTDGSVDLSSNHPLLRFHTSSEELARQVRLILLMFGVHARIHRTVRKRHALNGREIRHDRPKYDVVISGASLGRFIEQIRLSHPEKRRRLEEAALRCNFTGGNWAAQVVKIEFAGYETVYDLYEPQSDTWITEGYVSRGCGEQWLGPYENCCLGSVNLARHVKYVNGKAEVDWEKLRETVEWATRFLDNVVQVNQYVPAVPQLKEAAFKTRRIGLGFMGLADLMYHLRIRYGSEEGQEFAAQIAEFIRYHAMRTSIELARERGPFPAIRGSIYDPEDLKWEPPKPLKPYTRDWGRPPLDWNAIVEGIRRHGIRNAAQTTVAPTGCLVAGTMIITDRGLLPIEALGDPNGPQWQDVDWVVASEGGPRRATKFYVNGVAHTLRLVTRRGYVLQGTDGHRIRVWENGKWVWRRLDELKPGMRIPIVAGMIGTPQRVELDIPANKDPRCTDVRFPSHITPELAYLVGFFMGDGSLKQRSMRLSVSDPELKEELVRRIREVFGVEPRLLQDPRSRRLWSVEIHSKLLVEFWRKNGFNKIPARPGHRGKGYQPHVPIKILQTNDPRIYGAFLAGLLDADGMIQRGHLISWSTTCREFHDQVKAMLLALGVLTTSDVQQTGISGAPLYRLRTAHAEATRRLVQQLELLLRLRVPGSNGHVRRSYLRDTIPLSDWEKNSLLAIAGSTREQMRVWGWRQRGLANRETAIAFVQTHREDLLHAGLESFVQAVEQPVFYDEIVAIEDGGWRETYDLSVPGTHAYIANGFVSHNTISTVAGCEGYGCEPVFALAYIRYVHEAEGRLELRYVSPLFMRALKEASLDEETRARIIEEVLRKGTCQHIQELPDWIRHTFVVAQDLTPEEHVWMQASIQAFIDNSISKTINFPEKATVEDVEKAYFLAWKLGCKGLTVYVAGSRQKEVLETLETKARKEQKEAAMVPAQPTLPQPVGPTVRPRPHKLAGVTYRIATPVGTAFITLNENGEGQPFEVFLNVGKAGSDIAAVAEAIGRLISLLLRLPSPVPPAERLRQVVDQLQGIGGGRALGFGPERVRSLPDGIARVLAEYLAERGLELPAAPAPAVQPALPLSEPHPGREEPGAMGPVGDICPQCGEATLLEQEGCRTCYNCGYSEC